MSRTALLYHPVTGDIVGEVYCSNDDDMTKQQAANLVVLDRGHAAHDFEHRKDWRVEIEGGRPVMRPRGRPE